MPNKIHLKIQNSQIYNQFCTLSFFHNISYLDIADIYYLLFCSGPIHAEHEGQHIIELFLDVIIILIETDPAFLVDKLNFIYPDQQLGIVKLTVFTSVQRESQNPYVIGYISGEDPTSKTTSSLTHLPPKYKSKDMKYPLLNEQVLLIQSDKTTLRLLTSNKICCSI
ncbi:unnamed protein product [Paramecium octaurelia]|uniref:Uncharacterized protein n=1 Tax=Paramecium octaurelia TaxID=43137 RepID=A0A8S1YH19_PAROT|nr:unnamed protein product [Paramecium octaurelia]